MRAYTLPTSHFQQLQAPHKDHTPSLRHVNVIWSLSEELEQNESPKNLIDSFGAARLLWKMIEFAQRIKEKILLAYKMNVYFMYLVNQLMQSCEEST